MSNYQHLEAYRKKLQNCVSCASCQAECPTYKAGRDEGLTARGKMNLIDAVLKEEIPMSERWVEKMSLCTSCLACETNCPNDVRAAHIITSAKAEYYTRNRRDFLSSVILFLARYPLTLRLMFSIGGILTRTLYQHLPEYRVLEKILPYYRKGRKRFIPPTMGQGHFKKKIAEVSRPVSGIPDAGEVLFFTGCMTDHAAPQTGFDVVKSLQCAGFSVRVIKTQLCCGAPFYFNGDFKGAKELARENIKVFQKYPEGRIFSHCATCGDILREVYPLLFADEPEYVKEVKIFSERVVDFHQLYQGKADKTIKSALQRRIPLKVTWHDPCHLNRGMGVKKEPREMLSSLQGVEYIEMEGADECCGGAGSFSLYHYDLALAIGERKARHILESGADIVVTGCPSCKMQLQDALLHYDNPRASSVNVLLTAELLQQLSERKEKKA